jgi:hypothetical protein
MIESVTQGMLQQDLSPDQRAAAGRLSMLRVIQPFLHHVGEIYAPSLEIPAEQVLDAILELGDRLLDPQVRQGMIFAMTVAKSMLDTGSSLVGLATDYCNLSVFETMDLMSRAFEHDEVQPILDVEMVNAAQVILTLQAHLLALKKHTGASQHDRGLALPS